MVVASHVLVVVKTIAGLAMACQRAEWSGMIIVGERVLTRHGFPVLLQRRRSDLFDHEQGRRITCMLMALMVQALLEAEPQAFGLGLLLLLEIELAGPIALAT